MKHFELAIELGKQFEGCKLTAYLCPAGKWTIGYGNTFFEDGTPVKRGDTITELRAKTLQIFVLTKFDNDISKHITAKLTAFQRAAVLDFAYNVGVQRFRTSTLLRKMNANPNDATIFKYTLDTDRIAKTDSCEFLRWVNKGTLFERGLRRRNQARCDMYTRRA
jgi:lysozyme